jgi:hypothetical protein
LRSTERRHNLGRGTLAVLDVVPESGTPSYEQRRSMLETLVATDAVFSGELHARRRAGLLCLNRQGGLIHHMGELFDPVLGTAGRGLRFHAAQHAPGLGSQQDRHGIRTGLAAFALAFCPNGRHRC